MIKHIINTDQAPAPIGPYSQAVAYGNLMFVSGQVALNPDSGEMMRDSVEAETKRVMANIIAILEAAGSNLDKVVKTNIFLTDLNDFVTVNTVYGSYFAGKFPARETIQVSRLPLDARVEISVIAGI